MFSLNLIAMINLSLPFPAVLALLVAETFNGYVVGKIKEGIDQSQIKDPLKKLAEKMINNKLKFSLKKIIQKQLKKGNEAVKKAE